ncbi:hypothetical protein JKP88DRAFT_246024 [Tribonema minus]|uniref:Serine protease n=1 Tax=Tribonema minus TaxID=303371 RepID=A0A836CCZ8_9STRA|nr:hypothetical protein JKP88DRAFT_246024 [Tribonema minus]
MTPIMLDRHRVYSEQARRQFITERVKTLVTPIVAFNSSNDPCARSNGILYLGGGEKEGNHVLSVAHLFYPNQMMTYQAVVQGKPVDLVEVKRGTFMDVDAVVFRCQQGVPALPAPMPFDAGLIGCLVYVVAYQGDATPELTEGKIISWARRQGTVALDDEGPCCPGAPLLTQEGALLGLMLGSTVNKEATFASAPVIDTFLLMSPPQLQGLPMRPEEPQQLGAQAMDDDTKERDERHKTLSAVEEEKRFAIRLLKQANAALDGSRCDCVPLDSAAKHAIGALARALKRSAATALPAGDTQAAVCALQSGLTHATLCVDTRNTTQLKTAVALSLAAGDAQCSSSHRAPGPVAAAAATAAARI